MAKLISVMQIDFCRLIKSIELISINAPETRSLGYDKSFFVDYIEVKDGIMNFVRTEEKVDGGYYEISEISVKVDGLKISKIE